MKHKKSSSAFVHILKKYFYIPLILLIFYNIYLASWLPIHGDIFYNEDVARDLLLLDHTLHTQLFTLIGARTLGITGLFHGPLWIYINLPAFIIGKGSPIVMGFFFVLLYITSLSIAFYLARRFFGKLVGLWSILLLSNHMYTFNNTYGAYLLFPFYYLCFVEYLKTCKLRFLITAFLLIGFIIQFEMAFGGPLLFVSFFYLLYFLVKNRKTHHLLAVTALAIPLAPFFIFELKHDFSQTHSLVSYFTKGSGGNIMNFSFLIHRIVFIVKNGLGELTGTHWLLTLLIAGGIVYGLFHANKKMLKKNIRFYWIFFILYGGYWLATLLYKENLWIWYYYEFTPVLIILFCSLYKVINKRIFFSIFAFIFLTGFYSQIKSFSTITNSFIGKDPYSWKLYSNAASAIYTDSQSDFGYYVYEHDLLGYRGKYALNYIQKNYSNKGYSNRKMRTTYLFIADGGSQYWKTQQVKINKNSVKTMLLPSKMAIEKYELNQNEVAIPSDPNLIDSLLFR